MGFQKGNIPWNKNKSNPFTQGKNNHFWKGGKIKRICIFCRKSFKTFSSDIKKGNGKYCSLQCYWNDSKKKKKGKNNSFYNKHHSIKTKLLWSNKRKNSGNPNWQGGKSFELYSEDWSNILKEKIRKRDNYTCQLCEIHQSELKTKCKKLDVHHMFYNKKDCKPNHLISLCKSCHMKTNYNRKHWIRVFTFINSLKQITISKY